MVDMKKIALFAAGQQLETSGTEQGAGSEQSDLLHIEHSSIPSFLSYSLMYPKGHGISVSADIIAQISEFARFFDDVKTY